MLCGGRAMPLGNVAELLAAAARDVTDAMEWASHDDDVCLLDKHILDHLQPDPAVETGSSEGASTPDVNRPLLHPNLEQTGSTAAWHVTSSAHWRDRACYLLVLSQGTRQRLARVGILGGRLAPTGGVS